jgi:hypothetical protein
MGRVQAVIAVAFLTFASGCAGEKFWQRKPEPVKFGEGMPSAALNPTVTGGNSNEVVQASATIPAAVTGASMAASTFAKVTGKTQEKKAGTPVELVLTWRNKIDYLPDPTRNGAMGAGIAGQMFLFDAKMLPALADGKLTVALYDESPRGPGQQPAEPQVWEFTKEVLKKLRSVDERWGIGYTLFLPWRDYRADVTRVRIAARFEPEEGHKLFAPETRITFDMSAPGSDGPGWTNQAVVPGVQPGTAASSLGGPPPTGSGPGLGVLTAPPAPNSATTPPAPLPFGTLQPAPSGYGSLAPVPATGPVTEMPAAAAVAPGAQGSPLPNRENLPPIAITIPRR